jgi:hypothetical protein
VINPTQQTGATIIVFGGTLNQGVSIDNSDITSILRSHITILRSEIRAASASVTDSMTKMHLQDVAVRIDNILDPKK